MFPGSQVIGAAFMALLGFSLTQHESQALLIGSAVGSVLLNLAFIAGGIVCASFILTRFLRRLL